MTFLETSGSYETRAYANGRTSKQRGASMHPKLVDADLTRRKSNVPDPTL